MAKSKGPPKKASKAGSKRTAAFKNSGKLQKTIEGRRKHQALEKKIKIRQNFTSAARKGKGKAVVDEEAEGEGFGGVDALLNGDFGGDESEEDISEVEEDVEMEQGEDSDEGDLESLEIDDEGDAHRMDLDTLKSKDPEFYKYLLENDKELLEFDPNESTGDASDQEGSSELTLSTIKEWNKNIVQTHSLRSLRRLLLAFRAAAQGENTVSQGENAPAFIIRDARVFNKVVVSTLRFTPLVLAHHCPAKKQASGKFKIATQTKAYATAQRLIRSYFHSLARLLPSLPVPAADATGAENLQQMALTESAKLVPYVVGNRIVAKHYQATLLEYWSTGVDSVKISAVLGLRALILAGDESIAESALKATYTTFISTCKKTSLYTLPAINLMKNSGAQLFLLRPTMSYQLAFNYIRQLALQLRKSVKAQVKEAYQGVYNWQVTHAVDFWSLVLSSACDASGSDFDKTKHLQPLVYPLVEVSLGIIRLVPTSRFFPLHFHIMRALIRIMQRTGTYIPLAAQLTAALDCPELKRKPKPSTQLKAFEFDYYIRAPTQYLRTKTYADSICDELANILLEYLAAVSLNIAFPEMVVPLTITIKRHLKSANKNPKLSASLKPVLEKVEANRAWIEERRSLVEFGPSNRSQVANFLKGEDLATTPLGAQVRRERKQRDAKRELLVKAARQKEAKASEESDDSE